MFNPEEFIGREVKIKVDSFWLARDATHLRVVIMALLEHAGGEVTLHTSDLQRVSDCKVTESHSSAGEVTFVLKRPTITIQGEVISDDGSET